ncbi:MAG: RIP metalloprotease RseP [Spirochaeta sp.]|jgi:regulator of sigma E protease|nr:RIP metalloprotease RseP [Spirochaeta sp.]
MINVLIGLAGLGLVIFLHELGHLLAAKSVGISVEAFSVGWGKKIWATRYGETEYRVSLLPIGGYCKMQGEHALLRAWQTKSSRIDVEPGDFYAATPMQRIFVLLAGPLVNFFFAVLVLAVIAIAGYSIQTFPNRIVLAADYGAENTVAEAAGLETGDRIVALAGETVETFRDIQTVIGQSAQEELSVTIDRDGETMQATLQPALDPSSGAGRIGVYPWIDPVIAEVTEDSAASLAGLRPGDQIVAVNGEPVENSIAVERAISNASGNALSLTLERNGSQREITVVPDYDENGQPRLGIRYEMITRRTPSYGLFGGLAEGVRQAVETLQLTLRGIGLLFRGVDLNQALMGPVRITYMVGEVATLGLEGGIGRAFLSFFNFLSLISITLFFMNLLPIPVLDGGQIVLSAIELTTRKPLHPQFVYHYQMVGNVIILALMFFALFNDILFFARG